MKNTLELLLGKTLTDIKIKEDKSEITFETEDGHKLRMYHSQDCCESVLIEEIIGDIKDLIGNPILKSEKRTNEEKHPYGDLVIWTFYEFATIKGSVTIRWLGQSNGFYSVSVDLKWS